MNYVVPKSDLN